VSLAPIRIPSSANTAPPTGSVSMKYGQSATACCRTARSPVNARGMMCASGSSTNENAAPTTTDHAIIRSAAA
jgi:hypothetical protein